VQAGADLVVVRHPRTLARVRALVAALGQPA
jgi:hypothetical protein